ncbi:NarK/NasA family nitrate transporter [Macrococcus brunensis]|uniref:Probable nitrate transporter NarT n=1 Tax=Macrococcus brunensis TaxID=198483 RepID=A0A4R6BF07_9STAP|nr:nitrate/nitrite transporter [Macrococcus brunensis]TDL98431.1 NarK/NasA family nitrate transporter [Macrococcus brunensis]ULG72097.1 NarK/NasA family nitrate transporter [Macrococcus brunensis]ULG74349.1 NarK/NasA family nitrate transporter [Macrococcus brunensis]
MNRSTGKIQLPLQTFSLMAGFMAWTIIAPLLPFMSQDFSIPESEKAMILAIPVILGSVLRIPMGYFANLIGARKVYLFSLVFLLVPIFFLSEASSTTALMIAGLFLGIGGAIFSVGVTSVPKYYPKEKHGFANGVYGMGNLGTAVSAFAAPAIAANIGWSNTVKSYLVVMIIFALLNFFLGDKDEPKVKQPLMQQIKGVLPDYKLYLLSFWYFITFGSFVAFGLFLPNFLVNNFQLDKVDAGIRTGTFIALATFLRPVGGMLGDKLRAMDALKVTFIGLIIGAALLSINHQIFFFTAGCLIIAACAGIGNGLIFKMVPSYYTTEVGTVNGIVSMMGGLGGFFPPLVIAAVTAAFGTNKLAFFFLALFGIIALLTMMWMDKKEQRV